MATYNAQGLQVTQDSYDEWMKKAMLHEKKREMDRAAQGGVSATQGMGPDGGMLTKVIDPAQVTADVPVAELTQATPSTGMLNPNLGTLTEDERNVLRYLDYEGLDAQGVRKLSQANTRTDTLVPGEIGFHGIDQWWTQLHQLSFQDPEAFRVWEQQNPEDAIRWHSRAQTEGFNDAQTNEEHQARMQQLSQMTEFGREAGPDGRMDGKQIALDYSGELHKDVNNEGGLGDFWKIGTPQTTKESPFNDFINNPIVNAGAALLAPVTAGLSTAAVSLGKVIDSGEVSFEDAANIAAGAAGAGGLMTGGIGGVKEIASPITGGTVGRAIREGVNAEGPTIGDTQVNSREGWHWEQDKNGNWHAVADKVPETEIESPGGGGGSTAGGTSGGIPEGVKVIEGVVSVNTDKGTHEESWRHTNPDGSVVAGNEVGDVWEVDAPEPKEDWISAVGQGLLGSVLGGKDGSSNSGSGSDGGLVVGGSTPGGSVDTGGSGPSGNTTGGPGIEGDGTDGTNDGTGGKGPGVSPGEVAGMLAAAPTSGVEWKDFMARLDPEFEMLNKLDLKPQEYLKLLLARAR